MEHAHSLAHLRRPPRRRATIRVADEETTERRADKHPAALLPAEPTLARRREDCTETPSHFLRVRPSAPSRPRRRNRRRRLPDSLAHVNRQNANAECRMMNDEWKAVDGSQ